MGGREARPLKENPEKKDLKRMKDGNNYKEGINKKKTTFQTTVCDKCGRPKGVGLRGTRRLQRLIPDGK